MGSGLIRNVQVVSYLQQQVTRLVIACCCDFRRFSSSRLSGLYLATGGSANCGYPTDPHCSYTREFETEPSL